MKTRLSQTGIVRRYVTAAMMTAVCLTVASPLFAQSAATRYQQAQARETAARKQANPTLATLRAIATAYENIVRRYPSSGYADNALWQAAGLLELAFERGAQARDRDQATKLLQWLAREYPHSSLSRQAKAKIGSASERAAASPSAPPAAARSTTAKPAAASARSAASAPAAAAPPLPNQILPAPITLQAITHTTLPKGDRITFLLSQEPIYKTERLAAANQLKFTLSNVGLSREALEAVTTLQAGLIRSLALTPKDGGTEIVLHLNGQPRHSAFPLYAPYRLVVDLESDAPVVAASTPPPAAPPAIRPAPLPIASTVSVPAQPDIIAAVPASAPEPIVNATPASTKPAAATPAPATVETSAAAAPSSPAPAPPASTSRGGYSLARQLGLGVSRIVIDPGHGGHDPGAQANGVTEAQVVLDVALRLEKLLLDQPGFDVVLTRRTNEYVALEERTAIANRESADLFVSIHVNASPQRDTRGIETYFLNFASNSHAEAVAARENASSAAAMRALPQLVKAITTNNKLAESRELAGMIQTSLLRQARTQNKDAKDLGVKQAPFVVLVGAEMPSVLAEIAFVTNRADANLLKQPAYRQRLAQALRDAILRYQGSLKKMTTVANVGEGR